MIPIENKPPLKLKIPETVPLVAKTKKAFRRASRNALLLPKKNNEYITTILDKPNFTPGAINGSCSEFSTNERTIATANKMPVNTIFLILNEFTAILPA